MIDPEDVVIFEPRGEGDLQGLHRLCMMHGREMAPATVNPQKVWETLRAAQDSDKFTILLAGVDGQMVGYLILHAVDWWFATESFLTDMGLFVIPEFRGTAVFGELLESAKAVGDLKQMTVRLWITNPERRRGRMCKEAELLGYTPLGSMLAFPTDQPPLLN